MEQTQNNECYANGRVLAPNGEVIFRAGTRKISWYLKKKLAIEVPSEDGSPTIKLLFEPAGRGNSGDPYLLANRESVCVVCGKKEELSRHHIVPYCFIRHLPAEDKNHNSYDVVLLCLHCHRKYETQAQKLQVQLCQEFVPTMKLNNKHTQTVISAANALLKYESKLSDKKKIFCIQTIHKHLKKTEHTIGDLEAIVDTNFNETIYKTIVEQQNNFNAFARRWRYHFLVVMQPKHMNELWNKDRDVYQIRKKNET